MNEQAIEFAVNWWVDLVTGKGQFDDAQFDEEHQPVLDVLRRNARASHPIDDELVQRFRIALTERLRAVEDDYEILDCDYHPSGLLSDACEDCGFPDSSIPIKTSLRIDGNEVSFQNGYGAGWSKKSF